VRIVEIVRSEPVSHRRWLPTVLGVVALLSVPAGALAAPSASMESPSNPVVDGAAQGRDGEPAVFEVRKQANSNTYAPAFLGGRATKVKPKRVGVGAKGVWESLRWRRWGRSRAYARGVYDIAGFAGEPGTGYRGAIAIRAYGRKACGGGRFAYTKVLYRLRKPIGGKRVFREAFGSCA